MSAATLAAALGSACERFADRPALVDAGGTMGYAELGGASRAVAAAYRELGIGRGDRVVCQLPDGRAHFVAVGAAWAAGVIHVAADRELTPAETAELVRMAGARGLLHPAPGEVAAAVHAVSPEVRLLSEEDVAGLAAAGGRPAVAPPAPDDVAAIFTTSGSTGKPKLPVGLHGKLGASWSGLAGMLDFGTDDVHLVQLPLAHGFGLMLATAGLLAGGRLVVLDRFTPAAALEAMERERVTVLNGTPAHFKLLIDRRRERPRAVDSLRIGVGAGAAFSKPLLEAIFADLDMQLVLMYGSSEGVGVATRDRDDILAGSVGRPEPEGSVAVLDADGRPLPHDEVGEIAFARECNPVRYWGEPAAAAEQRAVGWYRSGDLGRFDERGRLHVVGRIKHQINRGGLKIDPTEVEAALQLCRGIVDAAVVGVPNPFLDEVVCACVVPSGAGPTLEDLRAELSGRLAPFKLPEELCVLERIPRTALGKVDHELLRGLALASTRQSTRGASAVA